MAIVHCYGDASGVLIYAFVNELVVNKRRCHHDPPFIPRLYTFRIKEVDVTYVNMNLQSWPIKERTKMQQQRRKGGPQIIIN